jgi:lambda family phage tail tape measure protein
MNDFMLKLEAANNLYRSGRISADEYIKVTRDLRYELLQTATDWQSGLERAGLALQREFTDVASLIENSVVNAVSSMEDALVTFVRTGKFEFSDLVNSILDDLTRIAARQAITAPLASALGGVLGGLFGGGGSSGVSMVGSVGSGLPGFASGGDFRVGGAGGIDSQLVAFRASPGEEVYIRKPGERDPASGGGGGAVVVQPIINNYASDKVSTEVRTQTDSNGNVSMEVIIDAVESSISGRVDSGNSSLLSSMSRALGVSPKPRGG